MANFGFWTSNRTAWQAEHVKPRTAGIYRVAASASLVTA